VTTPAIYLTIHSGVSKREERNVKWLVIGLGLLFVAAIFRQRMRAARWEQWVDADA